jgi:branched-chain amino acid transport system substrate-binding protein
VALDRDRAYVVTLVLTLVAICAFGVFIIRDFQDQGAIRAGLVSGGQAAGGGGGGDTTLATPGAGGTAANAAGGAQAGTGGQGAGGSHGAAPVSVPGGQRQGCVGGVINIGQIVPITGPVTQRTAAQAVAAYFKNLNSNGGINGCQVNFTYLDDAGLNQQQAKADAVQLVQDAQVFAIVGNVEPVTTASTEPYFLQAHVPVIGVDGVGINEYNSAVEYSFAESPAGFGISTANYANKLGKKRLAVFYLDFDFGHASFDALQKQAAANGQTIVYSKNEDVSSQGYGTDTLSAQQANPDVVINIMDANSVVREFNAMASNKWYPDIVGTTSTSDPVVNQQEGGPNGWLSNPAHVIYVQRNYQPADANIPEVQEWISVEGRYFSGFDPNSYAEGAWLGAKTFADTARRLGTGNLTRDNLFNALNSLQNYHNGFTPDVTMTGDHGPNRQVLWLKWSATSNKYAQISGFVPW